MPVSPAVASGEYLTLPSGAVPYAVAVRDRDKDASIESAYERLRLAIARSGLDPDSHIRKIALDTLDKLREQIQHDPELIEQLIGRIAQPSSRPVIEKTSLDEEPRS